MEREREREREREKGRHSGSLAFKILDISPRNGEYVLKINFQISFEGLEISHIIFQHTSSFMTPFKAHDHMLPSA